MPMSLGGSIENAVTIIKAITFGLPRHPALVGGST